MTVIATCGLTVCGVIAGYGANANKIEALQSQATSLQQASRDHEIIIAAHDKQLAVEEARYLEIIRRLENIERKL